MRTPGRLCMGAGCVSVPSGRLGGSSDPYFPNSGSELETAVGLILPHGGLACFRPLVICSRICYNEAMTRNGTAVTTEQAVATLTEALRIATAHHSKMLEVWGANNQLTLLAKINMKQRAAHLKEYTG